MCGIAGIYRFRGSGEDGPVVERMLTHLVRRGPDDSGVTSLGPATLGNRRLAILDLSPAGHQPMRSSSGRFVVTFNGEIYNYQDVRRELDVDAASLRSTSDTEVLLLAWERWGPEALPRLVGQWAFALYDTAERKLWLARDRFGEKPLFHHENPERFAFASSVEALLEAPGTPRELEPAAIAEYVTLRYVVSPRTVLRDVRKLAPGHVMAIGPGGIVSDQAWFMPRFRLCASVAPQSHAARVEEFDARFTRACERCTVSDVPVALLLSDGIDSNAVRAALAQGGHPLAAYTFRPHGDGAVPERLTDGASGEVLDLEAGWAERIRRIDRAFAGLTEPVGDAAALATWMLIHNARERATVFLCGHGGDEVLGGYRLSQDRFRLALLHRMASLPPAWTRSPMERFLYGEEPLEIRRAALRRASMREAPAAARYIIHRPLPVADVHRLLGGALPPGERYLGTLDRLYADCDAQASDLDRMQEVMLRTFLSENILTFADSVAMDSSAELRMPFLDRDVVDFALALPSYQRVGRWPGRANTKLVLREWSKDRLSPEIVRRRKRPFQAGTLSELLEHDGAGVRGRILDAPAVRRVLPGVEGWLKGLPPRFGGPWGGTYWALVALGVWCEALHVG